MKKKGKARQGRDFGQKCRVLSWLEKWEDLLIWSNIPPQGSLAGGE